MQKEKEAPKRLVTKPPSPFDIIGMMFSKTEKEFNEIPDNVLEMNYFIINQIMGIQFPLQAEVFNHTRINGAEVVRFWRVFLHFTGFHSVPGFVYTKGKKKAADANIHKKEMKIPLSLKKRYADKKHVSLKDVDNAIEIYKQRTTDDIMKFKKEMDFIDNIERESFVRLKK